MLSAAPTSTTTQDPTRIAIGSCPQCGHVTATRTIHAVTCPMGCGVRVELHWVTGTVSNLHRCDAACWYAHTRRCTCACGGGNHGAGYLDPQDVPAHIRDRDTQQHHATTARRAASKAADVDRRAAATANILNQYPQLVALLGDAYRNDDDPALQQVRRGLTYNRPLPAALVASVARFVEADQRQARRG